MGIFFNAPPLKPVVVKALQDAIQMAPTDAQHALETATTRAATVETQVTGSFSWVRLLLAIVALAALFAGCVYTAHDEKLHDLYTGMVHAFEVLLGGVIGIILGESASRP